MSANDRICDTSSFAKGGTRDIFRTVLRGWMGGETGECAES